jgi:hypothetical protein
MTREEARARAEEIVYVYCNLGDILCRCERAGIPTHTPKGKQRSRTELETELIEHYTNEFAKTIK